LLEKYQNLSGLILQEAAPYLIYDTATHCITPRKSSGGATELFVFSVTPPGLNVVWNAISPGLITPGYYLLAPLGA
jgi:hypothetical protein